MRKRTKRPDRFTNPDDVGKQDPNMIYQALAPLDRVAAEMESKWGVDRLPTLVPPDVAAKFGKAVAQLDEAIDANDVDLIAQKAAALMRGWQFLDKTADDMGAKRISSEVWLHTLESGFAFAVAKTNAEAIHTIRSDPALEGVPVYTMAEIGRILESKTLVNVTEAKKTFPGAQVLNITNTRLDDEIPF